MVLVLGIVDRVSDSAQIPDVLGSWPVLAAAGAMYLLEFVPDKIPYVDGRSRTNVTARVVEDAGVLGVVWLAAVIAAILLVLGLTMPYFLSTLSGGAGAGGRAGRTGWPSQPDRARRIGCRAWRGWW